MTHFNGCNKYSRLKAAVLKKTANGILLDFVASSEDLNDKHENVLIY